MKKASVFSNSTGQRTSMSIVIFQSQSFENFINFIKYLVLVGNQCWLAGQWLGEMNAEP